MAFRGLNTKMYILLERKKEKKKPQKPRGSKFKMVCKQQQRNKIRIPNENDFQARFLHQVRLRIKSDKRMGKTSQLCSRPSKQFGLKHVRGSGIGTSKKVKLIKVSDVSDAMKREFGDELLLST